jgi:hypothetical protein
MHRLLATVLVSSAIGCESPPPVAGGGDVETRVQELQIPGIKVGKGTPTGTYFNGTLFLAYTGTEGNIHTLQRSGSGFIDHKTIFTSKYGPSLIAYHDKLILTWIDGGDERYFAASKSLDGVQWDDAGSDMTDHHLKHAPALVIYNDVLFRFDTNDKTFWGNRWVHQFAYDEGSNTWPFVTNPGAESNIGPSAAVLGNDLFLAVADTNNAVLIQKFDSVLGWQSTAFVGRFERPHLIAAGTSPPSLLLLGSGVGNIGPNEIYFDRTVDGVNMEALGHIGDTTNERPNAIRADGSSVEIVYRGTNDRLFLITARLPAN